MINSFFFIAIIAGMSIGLHRLRTGQTTSFRTGDDGDLEYGRDTSHSVLASNNPFGNTNRFTDELGGQTYTLGIVIDWSSYDGATVFGIDRTPFATAIWNTAIDNCLAHTLTGFTSGWFMPNKNQLMALHNLSLSNSVLNYSPININLSMSCSSTWTGATSYGWINEYRGIWTSGLKSSSYQYIAMREFTVTGTTLT